MISLKRPLAILLSLTIALPTTAFAQRSRGMARTPENMLALVDAYISEVRSEQPGGKHLEVGKALYIAKGIVGQVITMSAEDFNMFLFYTIERYVKEPKDRPEIYMLLEQLQKTIAVDLFNTQQLREGPYHHMVTGAYTWMGWILLAYVGLRYKAMTTMRGKEFLANAERLEIAASRNKLYSVGYKVATHPLAWASIAGSGLGYWEYLIQSNRVHRLDPLEVLKVVQAQIACHLSYKGLELQNEFDRIAKIPEDDLFAKDAQPLREKIGDVIGQSMLLEKQFKRLENLEVSERLFMSTLKQFPQSQNWEQFRNALNTAETEKDGQCRQMGMPHLRYELGKTVKQLVYRLPAEPTAKDLKERWKNRGNELNPEIQTEQAPGATKSTPAKPAPPKPEEEDTEEESEDLLGGKN